MSAARLALPLVALLAWSGARAQYRDGLPPVMTPPPHYAAPDPAGVLAGFADTYRRQGAPRVIVFWNRALSDATASAYELRSDSRSDTHGAEDLTLYADGRTITRDSTTESSSRMGLHRTDDGKRGGLSERADWRAEEGFNKAMLANGVRLVDRAMAIRATAAGPGGGGGDAVAAESAALAGKADLLVEILQTPDASAPSGYAFRVDVKDVRSGALLANFVTRGDPPQGPRRFVAGGNGYERERPRAPSIGTVGAQVGQEMLTALATHWR